MTREELKDLIRNSAQKPIRVCLVDGASYKVSHSDFAFTTTGSLILASGPGHEVGGEFIVCPLHHITRVAVLKRRAKAV